jgi:hypothetical protein
VNETDAGDASDQPRNLPELIGYAEANGWALVEDVALPASEWRGGPTGMPGWRLMFVKQDHAIGYEWFGTTSRHDACRKLLRALVKWDAEQQPRLEIVELGRDVYGDSFPAFMDTPRRSLGGRTPRQALADGDVGSVREILVNAREGHWL